MFSIDADGDPVVDSLANGEAFLVFRQVRVEAFRQDKQLFAGSFTMGKCDCRDMWIYPYMPTLVGTALAVLVGMVLVVKGDGSFGLFVQVIVTLAGLLLPPPLGLTHPR